MYSLHLRCAPSEVEAVSETLWEFGTAGIREEETAGQITLIAAFDSDGRRPELMQLFSSHQPHWEQENDTDWVAATEAAWPGREVGDRLYLAPLWNTRQTPLGRVRITHNPGLASGTGEHPCTQMALEQLERHIREGSVLVDVGTGSGILSVAGLQLGARAALALDTDFASLETARENFELNGHTATIVCGSADCVASDTADVVVANISGTVLLSLADELLRIVRPGGSIILTGYPDSELEVLRAGFGEGGVRGVNEWRCLTLAV